MNDNQKFTILATLLASPFFGWVYPTLWDWMGTATTNHGDRLFGLLLLSALTFTLVWIAGAIFQGSLADERTDRRPPT